MRLHACTEIKYNRFRWIWNTNTNENRYISRDRANWKGLKSKFAHQKRVNHFRTLRTLQRIPSFTQKGAFDGFNMVHPNPTTRKKLECIYPRKAPISSESLSSRLQSIEGLDYLVITPDRSLTFPSVEYVRSMISKQGSRQGTDVPVVIDSTHIQAADFTAAKVRLPLPLTYLLLIYYVAALMPDARYAPRMYGVYTGISRAPARLLCIDLYFSRAPPCLSKFLIHSSFEWRKRENRAAGCFLRFSLLEKNVVIRVFDIGILFC